MLGWSPRVGFASLIEMMVAHDVELARRERAVSEAGFVDPARGAALAAGN